MNTAQDSWHENVLPKNFDRVTYVALAAVAVATFIFGLLLTNVVFASLAALIIAALLVVTYRASLTRPALVALEADGMRCRDRRGREKFLPWASVLEIRPATQRVDSHYLCVYRDERVRRSVPLGRQVGELIARTLEGTKY